MKVLGVAEGAARDHVDVCAVRYEGIERETKGIHARIKRLEQIVISGSGAIILLLLTMILKGH